MPNVPKEFLDKLERFLNLSDGDIYFDSSFDSEEETLAGGSDHTKMVEAFSELAARLKADLKEIRTGHAGGATVSRECGKCHVAFAAVTRPPRNECPESLSGFHEE